MPREHWHKNQQNIKKSSSVIYKKNTHHNQLQLNPAMQNQFSIQKSINIIHYINSLKKKKKTHMIISLDTEKHLTTMNSQQTKNRKELP